MGRSFAFETAKRAFFFSNTPEGGWRAGNQPLDRTRIAPSAMETRQNPQPKPPFLFPKLFFSFFFFRGPLNFDNNRPHQLSPTGYCYASIRRGAMSNRDAALSAPIRWRVVFLHSLPAPSNGSSRRPDHETAQQSRKPTPPPLRPSAAHERGEREKTVGTKFHPGMQTGNAMALVRNSLDGIQKSTASVGVFPETERIRRRVSSPLGRETVPVPP
ncbi:hypothetical protein LX36DRAFT_359153 [Colletotrichum falcatum]|nr:hypothetical protein LX36DRAFT_359153 [Colletotrichum falcatum]